MNSMADREHEIDNLPFFKSKNQFFYFLELSNRYENGDSEN